MSVGPDEWDPAAPSEDSREYDGVFSWAGESHAFIIGLVLGFIGAKELMVALAGFALGGAKAEYNFSNDPHVRQVAEEPAYALSGLAVGFVLNLLIIGKPLTLLVGAALGVL